MLALSLTLLLGVAPHASERAEGKRPADHVIVLMLDGTRPDALRDASAPTLHRLAAEGVEYVQAETIYPSLTRVAFVSLPTGCYPASHGIIGADFKDAEWRTVHTGDEDLLASQALCACPTFFEPATGAQLTSLYAAVKGYELVGARGATWTISGRELLKGTPVWMTRYDPVASGSEDLAFGYKELLTRRVFDEALSLIREKRPNLAVLNLATADYTAHSFGPQSAYYLRSIAFNDALVAELLETLRKAGALDRTAVIVSADHGFSAVDPRRVVSPGEVEGGHRVDALADQGIEHYALETGGSSMALWIRDKRRLGDAVARLRREPWCESVYCDAPGLGCERTLGSLHAAFPGRAPDLMVDVDDDVSLTWSRRGQHGSLRSNDMRIPLILWGAGVAKQKTLGKAGLVDVAPTVLRLLGLDPAQIRADGHVLEEALAP